MKFSIGKDFKEGSWMDDEQWTDLGTVCLNCLKEDGDIHYRKVEIHGDNRHELAVKILNFLQSEYD